MNWYKLAQLSPLKAREIKRILKNLGFNFVRITSGGHETWKHPDGRVTTVTEAHRGKDMPIGTLRNIVRQVQVPPREFMQARR